MRALINYKPMNNNKNIMLAIRAYGCADEAVEVLEGLGGVDRHALADGDFCADDVLFVRSSGLIDCASEEAFLREFGEGCVLSMEELEEACPFVVGAAVEYNGPVVAW